MKIKLTPEQYDLLIMLLPRVAEHLERDAANLAGLAPYFETAHETAQEWYQLSQDIAGVVSLLLQYQEEVDHA